MIWFRWPSEIWDKGFQGVLKVVVDGRFGISKVMDHDKM
jgi:hypothetical protein